MERTEAGNPHSCLVMICQADPLKNAAPQLGCIHLLTWQQLQWRVNRSRDYQHHNVLDGMVTSITKTLADCFCRQGAVKHLQQQHQGLVIAVSQLLTITNCAVPNMLL